MTDMMTFFNKPSKQLLFGDLTKSLILFAIAVCFMDSCSKNDVSGNIRDALVLKATIDSDKPETKTQYSYINKYLKTFWKEGDEIALFSSNTPIYKFIQKGPMEGDGICAYFVSDELPSFQSKKIFAVYPYSSNLSFSLKSQTGKIDDLSKYDFLIASESLDRFKDNEAQFSFGHLCAILRLSKGMKVSEESNNGRITFVLKGEVVANELVISKSGDITTNNGEISISAIINDGKLTEDIYISFIPVGVSEGVSEGVSAGYDKYYKYTIDTDKGDHYVFYRNAISTSVVYNVIDLTDGIVEFDDENFKTYCLESYDYNQDGEISYAEARTVKSLWIKNTEIRSLKGIEHFKYLEKIYCSNNQLTSLDLSNCQKLKDVDCSNNQLTSLNVSFTYYGRLDCSHNQLSSLDLRNSSIEYLHCEDNQLTTLDFNSSVLYNLYCSNNQLTSLNLKDASRLNYLDCSDNQLPSLDLSNNHRLFQLECSNNQLKSLDVDNKTNLYQLYCGNNSLTSLNVNGCTKLSLLNCKSNHLTSLNVSGLTNLESLLCADNDLTSLNASGCTSLSHLSGIGNNLSLLDISDCTHLTELDLSGKTNYLKVLKVSGCWRLLKLNCYGGNLSSLDLSGCTALQYLSCSYNQLTSLDLSNNYNLETLYCGNNQLTILEVGNSKIKSIHCPSNKLTSLKFGEKASLIEEIFCENNKLNSLDVGKVTSLKILSCYDNQITLLDVSQNSKLTDLYAWPQITLKTLIKKKGQSIKFWENSATYGFRSYKPNTNIIVEVE